MSQHLSPNRKTYKKLMGGRSIYITVEPLLIFDSAQLFHTLDVDGGKPLKPSNALKSSCMLIQRLNQ